MSLAAPASAWRLPPALAAECCRIAGTGPPLVLYRSAPRPAPARLPVLLVHAPGLAASAAELRPLFDRLAAQREVAALELPGFGAAAGGTGPFTPRVMQRAIVRAAAHLRAHGGAQPAHLLAVALSCEFAAMAVLERPGWFRSLALVSPTGLEIDRAEVYDQGLTHEQPLLRALLERPPWSAALYRLLTRRPLLAWQLRRRWEGARPDDALLDHAARCARLPGAQHAAWAWLAGALATRGVAELYARVAVPVWVAHGARARRADIGALARLGPPSHWQVERFHTGALPFAEAPERFVQRYERFTAEPRHLG